MQASLDHLNRQPFCIMEEDKARLSPLSYAHINVLGQYSFILAENVIKGELRPLNQITDLTEENP